MRFAACFAAVRIIAETIASLPLKVYERLPGGGRAEVTQHPAAYLLNNGFPNDEMTPFDLRETQIQRVLTWGNGYARAYYNARGEVSQLDHVQPWEIRPFRTPSGELLYERTLQDGRTTELDRSEVLHLRGLGGDGLVGWSPVRLMAESVGMGLAAERFGAAFYGNAARPSMIVVMPPGKQLGDVAERNLRETIEQHSAGRAHRPLILDNGADPKMMTMPLNEAQFIEARKFQVEEVARIYRVPLHMLGDLERATFSNIEQQSLDFEKHTIRPWLVRFEQQYNRLLISKRQQGRLFVKHSVEGLLRGDIKTRYEAHAIALQNGWENIDEVRVLEDKNPLPNGMGEKHFVPLNMTTIDKAIEGNSQPVDDPPTGPADPPSDPPQPGEDDSRAFLRHLLEEAVRGLIGREVHNATRAAKRSAENGANIIEWCESFYAKHEDLMVQRLGEQHRSAIRVHVEQSSAALVEATECRREEIVNRFEAVTEDWESERTDSLVNAILEAA